MLEKIIAHKRAEVETRKTLYPVRLLEQSIFFGSPCVSLKKYLLRTDRVGIIAEFKRKSPSKGVINAYAQVERTAIGYMQAGASALSVLTDGEFFGGKNEDLTTARKYNYCPILRKDFIVDEYQVIEAKSIGADAILLMASVLDREALKRLSMLAHSLSLECLFEIHDRDELSRLPEDAAIIGVNNRNLHSFQVDLQTSFELAEHLPSSVVKVAESGLRHPADVTALRQAGYQGFLIGESFMRHSRPEKACAEFIQQIGS